MNIFGTKGKQHIAGHKGLTTSAPILEVTKVEKPKSGDKARAWEPVKEGQSIYFNYLNWLM